MKRFSFVLAVLLLMVSVLPLGATAAAPEPVADIDNENLILHLDFEKTTSTGRPLDISPVGTRKEDFFVASTKDANGNPMTYLKDGIGHIDASGDNYISCGALGDDIRACTEMTVFTVFKANGTPTGSFANVLDLNNVVRPFITVNGLYARATSLAYSKDIPLIKNGKTGHPVEMDQFVWVAFSMSWDQQSKVLTSTTYVSNDGGVTYKEYAAVNNNVETMFSDCKALYIGKLQGGYKKSGILSFDFDDFRIYNKALNRAEVESIEIEKAPANVSVQEKKGENSFDVRFCATLDSLDYEQAGFEISAVENGKTHEFSHASTKVYESIMALGQKVTATELGGTYLMAYAIKNIPSNLGELTFTVKPFVVKNGMKYYGDAVVVNYNGSAYVGA